MPFLAAGTTDTKFLGSTGVATANSTNKYQKYKSVELGDQLMNDVTCGGPTPLCINALEAWGVGEPRDDLGTVGAEVGLGLGPSLR